MDKPERLELKSVDGAQLNLDALYQIAPSCFTEAKDPKTGKIKRVVNFDVLRQLLGDDTVEDAPEAYEFNWVGKQEARAEVLRPINKTLRPVKEDSVDWDNTQNLYIEGDNLEVLKLLQKSYLGKVKMIYIDPPYNTGNDFVYHDDFARTQADEDLLAGNVDELGNRYRKNTDSNGKYHSDWCSMIYSRLMVARSLLSDNGIIFASIDDHEVVNLRKICDEVFGEKQFITNFVWEKGKEGGNDSSIMRSHYESIVCYCKDINASGIINLDPKDISRHITEDKEENLVYGIESDPNKGEMFQLINMSKQKDYTVKIPLKDGSIIEWPSFAPQKSIDAWIKIGKVFVGEKKVPYVKSYLKDEMQGQKPSNIITQDYGTTKAGSIEIRNIFGDREIFSYPKPSILLKRLASIGSDKNGVILDFFSGSGSMAQAIMELNKEDNGKRRFLLVQINEKIENGSAAAKAGFNSIPDIARERIRRVGKKIKEESPLTTQNLDTGFRVFRVDESNFEDVERTPKEYNQDQLDLFLNNVKSDRNDLDLLFGCMLDWGVKLSLPMASEKVDGKMIYTVNDGDLVACFADKVTDSVVKAMADKQPLRVIFRDSCFEQDADKINIYETFKQLLDWSDKDVEKNIRVI